MSDTRDSTLKAVGKTRKQETEPLVNVLLSRIDEVASSTNTIPALTSRITELVFDYGQLHKQMDTLLNERMDSEQLSSASSKTGYSGKYAAKKTVAQGMMDLALITANANQLRYVIQYQSLSPTYYFVMTLIVISILLQLIVGICLIFKGRYDLKGEEKRMHANAINNYVIVGIFLVTVINVFIAAFSIGPDVPATVASQQQPGSPLS